MLKYYLGFFEPFKRSRSLSPLGERSCPAAGLQSNDSDIFHILLHHAHQLGIGVMFDTRTGDKRRMLYVTELSGELDAKYCDCILGLYVFTGDDTNCTLKGKGKILSLKKYQKPQDFNKHFADWETSGMLVMVLRMSWKI